MTGKWRKGRGVARGCMGVMLAWACTQTAWGQATVKRDGQWRSALGIGGSVSSGNTRSTNLTMTGEAVRATERSKWSLNGRLLYATAGTNTTADNKALTSQYDKDMSERWFVFNKEEYLRDEPANLKGRYSLVAGPGLHLIRTDDLTLDVSAGLAYTLDRYVRPGLVAGRLRDDYGRAEWMAGEDMSLKISPNASLRQKLTVFTNTHNTGGYRSVFEAGLSVAITSRMNLTAGFTHRYERDPGLGL
ncbi:MAG: DUF481 domain-containing protein, partial [Pseudomonadota bacterium]